MPNARETSRGVRETFLKSRVPEMSFSYIFFFCGGGGGGGGGGDSGFTLI